MTTDHQAGATLPGYGMGAAMAGGGPKKNRQGADYYPTPADVTQALMERERFTGGIWEPACGCGAMVKVMETAGHPVVGTDLIDRGMGGGVDFLATRELLAPNIITNPPFALAERFIRHAHQIGAEAIAMLLKATYWHAGRDRGPLWRDHRPAAVHAVSWRVDFLNKGAPTMEVAWFVWRRGYTGPTVYDVLERPAAAVPRARYRKASTDPDLFGPSMEDAAA